MMVHDSCYVTGMVYNAGSRPIAIKNRTLCLHQPIGLLCCYAYTLRTANILYLHTNAMYIIFFRVPDSDHACPFP